jgi:glutaredoxin
MAGPGLAEERLHRSSGQVVPDIVLFSQPYCPGCEAAKHHFVEQQIPYREFDISESDAARETFERLGGRGTPFLLINGKRLQGFSVPALEYYLTETREQGSR